MSNFIRSTAGMQAQMLEACQDARPYPNCWDWTIDSRNPWGDAVLWPNSASYGNNTSWLGAGTEYPRWAPPPDEGGSQSMKKFVGITRDSAGAVLASSVVQGFVTSTDAFVREVTSDAGGWFELCSENVGVNHYLVAYKAGSPDVAGTTVNTLQPS